MKETTINTAIKLEQKSGRIFKMLLGWQAGVSPEGGAKPDDIPTRLNKSPSTVCDCGWPR